MKILLVIDFPHSSLEVIAKAIVSIEEKLGLEVFILYKTMFIEAMEDCPQILSSISLVHFIVGVELFSYKTIEIVSLYCPIISHYHHHEFSKNLKQYFLVSCLIYVSKIFEKDVKLIKVINNNTRLLHSGVDTSFFKDLKNTSLHKTFTIGLFGVHVPDGKDRKGSVLLVRTVKRLLNLGYYPKFLIVGYGWKKLVKHLCRMGLNVSYKVNVASKEMPKLYNKLDLYLITSLIEGGPLTLLEAAACRVPIISTPVGLSLEILTKPSCGRILNGFDDGEIATAIINDIENYKAAKDRAICVQNEIQKNWNWKCTYSDLHDIYCNVNKLRLENIRDDFYCKNKLRPYLNFDITSKDQRRKSKKCALFQLLNRINEYEN